MWITKRKRPSLRERSFLIVIVCFFTGVTCTFTLNMLSLSMIFQETKPHFLDLPLNEITRFQNGEEGLLYRLDAELKMVEWSQDDLDRVNAALALAYEAHKNDTRGPYPYSTHFLRVAIRILSEHHLNIRDNPDLIIAALLHDTVEDAPEFYLDTTRGSTKPEMQSEALKRIDELFDGSVSYLVGKVTNPQIDTSLPKLARNELYREHVVEILATEPLAGIIKLSDFIDNCAGLKHNESPKRARTLASKYHELIPVFLHFVVTSDYLDDSTKTNLLEQLARANLRCLELMG